MKKNLAKLTFLTAILGTALFSCSKSSNSSSPQSNLVGTWKITSAATDNNGNGAMDPNEVYTNDTSWAHAITTFNSNGTMVYTYYSLTDHANWSLLDNNTYMKLTLQDTGVLNGYTIYQQVVTLTSTTMTRKDTTGGTAQWTTWTKQ